jgi:hypothetical protein
VVKFTWTTAAMSQDVTGCHNEFQEGPGSQESGCFAWYERVRSPVPVQSPQQPKRPLAPHPTLLPRSAVPDDADRAAGAIDTLAALIDDNPPPP